MWWTLMQIMKLHVAMLRACEWWWETAIELYMTLYLVEPFYNAYNGISGFAKFNSLVVQAMYVSEEVVSNSRIGVMGCSELKWHGLQRAPYMRLIQTMCPKMQDLMRQVIMS